MWHTCRHTSAPHPVTPSILHVVLGAGENACILLQPRKRSQFRRDCPRRLSDHRLGPCFLFHQATTRRHSAHLSSGVRSQLCRDATGTALNACHPYRSSLTSPVLLSDTAMYPMWSSTYFHPLRLLWSGEHSRSGANGDPNPLHQGNLHHPRAQQRRLAT